MALFTAFPAQDRSGTEAELAQIYALALEGVSNIAVQRATLRFIRGEVDGHNLTFRPTSAQISYEARHIDAELNRRADFHNRFEANRKRLPEPPRPREEVRKRVVKDALGYDPRDARHRSQAKQQRQFNELCDAKGVKPHDIAGMSNQEIVSTFEAKDKPWHNPDELRASMQRLEAFMDKQDPSWRLVE